MVKKAFRIAMYSVRQRMTDPRVACLFALMITYLWNDLAAIGQLTKATGIRTNPLLFPFFSSDPVKQLILLAGIIFLFADAPFINKAQPYIFIRSKRLPWLLGQILYILMASALYFLILMSASILFLLPNATFATNGWGKIVNTLAQTNAAAQIQLQFGVSEKITTYYTPFQAFGLCFLLNWGCASFLGLTMFLLNLRTNRRLGLVAGAIILFYDLLTINALPWLTRFSPVTLSRLTMLDPLGVSRYPHISYPFIVYGVSIVALSIGLVLSFRTTPIEITAEL